MRFDLIDLNILLWFVLFISSFLLFASAPAEYKDKAIGRAFITSTLIYGVLVLLSYLVRYLMSYF